MIVFGHNDDKYRFLSLELAKLGIQSDSVRARHPIFSPIYIIKLLLKGRPIRIYVFRYLNDCKSFPLALLRLSSEFFTVLLSKVFGFRIWWLCHNIDKETSANFPFITKLRRFNVTRNCEIIFTTSDVLIDKAKSVFPHNYIDSISLGYMPNGVQTIRSDTEEEQKLLSWLKKHQSPNSRIIFCIGSPAMKSKHFAMISEFIDSLNLEGKGLWYAVVVGDKVERNEFIYNIPYKLALSEGTIRRYAQFYFRVIDDFSISYSIYEACSFNIPIITFPLGILPLIVKKYNLGVIINSDLSLHTQLDDFDISNAGFSRFLTENNWTVAAKKLAVYYSQLRN